jgi:hypothetical protein
MKLNYENVLNLTDDWNFCFVSSPDEGLFDDVSFISSLDNVNECDMVSDGCVLIIVTKLKM